MAGRITPVKRYVRDLRNSLEAGTVSDEVLLVRFATCHDDAAFIALVKRHGPMILATCRRILGHAQDAEDACQVVLIVLARKAGSITDPSSLAGWLHGVAMRTALKMRARKSTRRMEQLFAETPAPDRVEALLWKDLRYVLDQEIHRLPDKYRNPFVLCYLEGKTNVQAAAYLGCPEGTVVTRLARARAKLRLRLVRRGVTISMGILAPALLQSSASAALSADRIRAVTNVALRFVPSSPVLAGVPHAPWMYFVKGIENAMLISRLRRVFLFLLATGLIVSTGGITIYRTFAAERFDEKAETILAGSTSPVPTDEPGQKDPRAKQAEASPQKPFTIGSNYNPTFEGGAVGKEVAFKIQLIASDEWQVSIARLLPPPALFDASASMAAEPVRITTFFVPTVGDSKIQLPPVPFTIEVPANIPKELQDSILKAISPNPGENRNKRENKPAATLDVILKRLDQIEQRLNPSPTKGAAK